MLGLAKLTNESLEITEVNNILKMRITCAILLYLTKYIYNLKEFLHVIKIKQYCPWQVNIGKSSPVQLVHLYVQYQMGFDYESNELNNSLKSGKKYHIHLLVINIKVLIKVYTKKSLKKIMIMKAKAAVLMQG